MQRHVLYVRNVNGLATSVLPMVLKCITQLCTHDFLKKWKKKVIMKFLSGKENVVVYFVLQKSEVSNQQKKKAVLDGQMVVLHSS